MMRSVLVKKRAILFFPLVFATLPVVYRYAEISGGTTTVPEVVVPLAIVIVGTVLLTLIAKFFFKEDAKAVAMVSVLLVIFFAYGPVHTWLLEKHGISVSGVLIGRPRYLLIISVVIALTSFWLLMRFRGNLVPLLTVVTAIALILVLVNVGRVLLGGQDNVRSIIGEVEFPDIYYFILDGYGRGDVLREIHDFDNNEFLDSLTQRGFFVASESRSNYVHTTLSIASSLNMRYLDTLSDRSHPRAHYAIIEDNAVLRFVKSRGYRYVHFASGLGITNQNKHADVQDLRSRRLPLLLSIFSVELVRSTSIGPLPLVNQLDVNTPFVADAAELFNVNMRAVRGIPSISGPTFTFIHGFPPHPPYGFDAAGNRVPLSKSHPGLAAWSQIDLYTGEVTYINGIVEEVVGEILRRSPTEPIIIIQADHGPRSVGSFEGAFDDPTDLMVFERSGILNAYYLPEDCRTGLYPAISPVNTFRVVFNSCLGADFSLLADETYFSVFDRDPHLSPPVQR